MAEWSSGLPLDPIILSNNVRGGILACGADVKNAFCFVNGNEVIMSRIIGDLQDPTVLDSFESEIDRLKTKLNIEPEIIAHDLHPGYFSTQYAETRNKKAHRIGVQHHHAHIVSCMIDNDILEPVIGVAFDGTGYGADGGIWGGEFLVADDGGFSRAAHFASVQMPGGEAAVRSPWRMAYSYLFSMERTGMVSDADSFFIGKVRDNEIRLIRQILEKAIYSPETTSAGRLFDVVSVLIEFREEVEYEGQAALELQAMCEGEEAAEHYDYIIEECGEPEISGEPPIVASGIQRLRVINCFPAVRKILEDTGAGVGKHVTAARFHSTVAQIINRVCLDISRDTGIVRVALSGGVFQNKRLLDETVILLQREGLEVLTHRRLPCNDSGIAPGQAIIADAVAEK